MMVVVCRRILGANAPMTKTVQRFPSPHGERSTNRDGHQHENRLTVIASPTLSTSVSGAEPVDTPGAGQLATLAASHPPTPKPAQRHGTVSMIRTRISRKTSVARRRSGTTAAIRWWASRPPGPCRRTSAHTMTTIRDKDQSDPERVAHRAGTWGGGAAAQGIHTALGVRSHKSWAAIRYGGGSASPPRPHPQLQPAERRGRHVLLAGRQHLVATIRRPALSCRNSRQRRDDLALEQLMPERS